LVEHTTRLVVLVHLPGDRKAETVREVGAALSTGGLANIKDLAELLGDPPGTASVNTELKQLEKSGLLERLPRIDSERRVHLRPVSSTYWQTCRDLAKLVHAHAGRGPSVATGRTEVELQRS